MDSTNHNINIYLPMTESKNIFLTRFLENFQKFTIKNIKFEKSSFAFLTFFCRKINQIFMF